MEELGGTHGCTRLGEPKVFGGPFDFARVRVAKWAGLSVPGWSTYQLALSASPI